jgi:hypothetical protein
VGENITVGEFTILDAATETAVTGVGFQPTAIIFWYESTNDLVDGWHSSGGAHEGYEFGVAANDGNKAADSHAASRPYNQSYCIMRSYSNIYSGYNGEVAVWGKIDGASSIKSWDSDGFTLQHDVDYNDDFRVFFMAIKAPNAAILHITPSGGVGDQAFSGAGFQPDFLFGIWARKASNSTLAVDVDNGWGWSDGQNDASFHVFDDSGLGVVDCKQNINQTEFINVANVDRGSVKSLDTDGFTVTWAEQSGGDPISVLCLGGVEAFCGSDFTRTDTTQEAVSGFGFQPQGVLFAQSWQTTFTTVNTYSDGIQHCFGAASGATERACVMMQSNDGASVQCDMDTWIESDQILVISQNEVQRGVADLVSLDDDGFTFVMDTADTSARRFIYAGLRVVETDYRDRLVKYSHNTFQSRRAGKVIVRDNLGRTLPPEQIEVDNWLFSGAFGFPTPTKYDSLLEDPDTFYVESIEVSRGEVRIGTDRESFLDTILRRLGRG